MSVAHAHRCTKNTWFCRVNTSGNCAMVSLKISSCSTFTNVEPQFWTAVTSPPYRRHITVQKESIKNMFHFSNMSHTILNWSKFYFTPLFQTLSFQVISIFPVSRTIFMAVKYRGLSFPFLLMVGLAQDASIKGLFPSNSLLRCTHPCSHTVWRYLLGQTNTCWIHSSKPLWSSLCPYQKALPEYGGLSGSSYFWCILKE